MKKKVKYASAAAKKAALEAEAYLIERDKRLGIKPGKIKPSFAKEFQMNTSYRGSDRKVSSVPLSGGICGKPKEKRYTGDVIVGIAVMHKSCLQPVISQQEAIDSARMRRG